jgi:hypothetical protein
MWVKTISSENGNLKSILMKTKLFSKQTKVDFFITTDQTSWITPNKVSSLKR